MTPQEQALRRALETINATIRSLCLQRDALAAQLPNAPRKKMGTHILGMEIKTKKETSR